MTKLKAFSKYFVVVTVVMLGTGYMMIDFMSRSNAADGAYSVSNYFAEKRVEIASLVDPEMTDVRVTATPEIVPESEPEIWENPEGSREGPFASFMRSAGSVFESASGSSETEDTAQADAGQQVEWTCEMVKTIKRCKVVQSD